MRQVSQLVILCFHLGGIGVNEYCFIIFLRSSRSFADTFDPVSASRESMIVSKRHARLHQSESIDTVPASHPKVNSPRVHQSPNFVR